MPKKGQLKNRIKVWYKDTNFGFSRSEEEYPEHLPKVGDITKSIVLSLEFRELNPQSICYAINGHNLKKLKDKTKHGPIFLQGNYDFPFVISLAYYLVYDQKFPFVAWKFDDKRPSVIMCSRHISYEAGVYIFGDIPAFDTETWNQI